MKQQDRSIIIIIIKTVQRHWEFPKQGSDIQSKSITVGGLSHNVHDHQNIPIQKVYPSK